MIEFRDKISPFSRLGLLGFCLTFGSLAFAQQATDKGGNLKFNLGSKETSVTVYGLAELNYVKEFKGDNSTEDYATFVPFAPINGTLGAAKRKGISYMHARTSRIGVKALTPTRFGNLEVVVEGDFNNNPQTGNGAITPGSQTAVNSYQFRLRQAYGKLAGFTVGQTWSTFMDIENAPEVVDFNGPIGSTVIRQGLIRYTYKTKKMGSFSASAENGVSRVLMKDPGQNNAVTNAPGITTVPDFVIRWDKKFKEGSFSLRALTHQFKVNNGDQLKASKRAYGFAGNMLLRTRSSKDALTLGVTYGKGIGRYIYYTNGAFLDNNGKTIGLEEAIGFMTGYQFKLNNQIRFNAVYGAQLTMDNLYTRIAKENGYDKGQYSANKVMQQVHGNVIYTPVDKVDLGLEYIWARRSNLTHQKGDLSRLNLMARYSF